MYPIETFAVDDFVRCSAALRSAGDGAETLERAAERIVEHLRASLVDASEQPACVLARLYKTHRFAELEPELQEVARRTGKLVDADTRCLTLVASRGEEAAWNDRRTSAGHRAIPLTTADDVREAPMVARLLTQLGLDVEAVIAPGPRTAITLHHRQYDIFFVPEALGSPFVPAQADFVEPYGIRSVIGFGGVLPSGDMFAVILFLKAPLPERTAEQFRGLALAVKAAIVPFTFKVFG